MLYITTEGEIKRTIEGIGQFVGVVLEPGDDPDEALKIMRSVPFAGRLEAPRTYRDMLPGADALRKHIRSAEKEARP